MKDQHHDSDESEVLQIKDIQSLHPSFREAYLLAQEAELVSRAKKRETDLHSSYLEPISGKMIQQYQDKCDAQENQEHHPDVPDQSSR